MKKNNNKKPFICSGIKTDLGNQPSSLYKAARNRQKTAYRKRFNLDFGWGWETLTQSEWVDMKLTQRMGEITEDWYLSTSWDSVKGVFQGWRNVIGVRGRNGLCSLTNKKHKPTFLFKKRWLYWALNPEPIVNLDTYLEDTYPEIDEYGNILIK